ncbi:MULTISPECIES: restriction endonuclease subunit S [Pseudomonas]|uniref:Restriction endonuclease subunit S n=1 Tax=Pseudomonas helleri TaxID=1608996 RepID=A0A7X1WUG2_9PSED|nr:restriction endonuclease subunit S [Pseudomonas helleri]MQT74794.1 restriction endonuclease subunit S [Pseudomonas helleri]
MSAELRKRWAQAGGTFPENWKVVPLETLLRDSKGIAVGVMYPGPNTPGGVPLIKVGDVNGGLVSLRPSYCISAEVNAEYKRTQLAGDELLITLVGNPGECVVVKKHMAGWNAARAIAVIRLEDPSLRVYLKTVLESTACRHLIDAVLNTTVQKTLNLKDIRLLPIPMPPKQVIQAISGFSNALNDRIALLRETNATLEAIAQALFKSWFIDFDPVRAKAEGIYPEGMDAATASLFPDSFEESELGLVPMGWRILPLEDAYEINPPRKLKKGEVAPYLDMASVGTQGHVVSGVVEREMGSGTKFINGDTLLARITPCLENGKSAFVDFLPVDQTGWGSTEFVVLRPRAPLPPYHGYLLARHSAFREHAIQSMSGTSGRQRVQNDVLGRYSVVVPSDEIAEAFGDVVGRAQQKIAANQEQAKTLTHLRDTLLPRLISGQLRLPETDTSIEDMLSEAV